MADGDTLLRLALTPVDSLFFRDARPFELTSRAVSGLPMPQTLAGAVRTLLLERHGMDFARLGERLKTGVSFAEALAEFGSGPEGVADLKMRGPWFTLESEVLVPTPASLRQEKNGKQNEHQDRNTGRLFRLDPLKAPLPGWQPQAPGMLPLWRYGRETVEATRGFLKPSGLCRFLQGGRPEPYDLVPKNDLYDFDDRTGIGVDPKRNTAAAGFIYGIRMLALKPNVGLYLEVSGPAAALAPLEAEPVLMKFGGEGRHVVIRAAERGANWPSISPVAAQGRLVLLTTPAWFDGWKPPGIKPVAAAVGGYQTVSGWDLAKGGPKPNRFMVPAGSVYFLPSGTRIPDELVNHEDATLGWGRFLEGNWSYV